MISQSRVIVVNTFIMWATRILMLVPQLVLTPYLIHTLGEAGYGLYALLWPMMLSIDQLELNLQQGVVKYCAAYFAKGDLHGVNQIVSSSFFYSITVGVIVCSGMIALSLSGVFESIQVGHSFVVIGFMVLAIVPLTPYVGVIQSQRRYYVTAIADTVSKYVALAVIFLWFHLMGPSVLALIVILSFMLFFSRLIQVPMAYRSIPGLRNRPKFFNWILFKRVFLFGSSTVLMAVFLAINTTGIRWLMGVLESTTFVAHLSILLIPGYLLRQVISVMTITVMPTTSACEATGDLEMLKKLMMRGMRYTTVLVMPGVLAASIMMKEILVLWVGAKYIFLVPYSLVFFASEAFVLSTSVVHHMLKGLGKLKLVLVIYFISFVLLPVMTIVLIKLFLGDLYLAVTVGLSLGNILCGVLNLTYGARSINIKKIELLKKTYGSPSLLAFSIGGLSAAVFLLVGIEGLWAVGLLGFLSVSAFFGLFYVLLATNDERKLIGEYLQLFRKKCRFG